MINDLIWLVEVALLEVLWFLDLLCHFYFGLITLGFRCLNLLFGLV